MEEKPKIWNLHILEGERLHEGALLTTAPAIAGAGSTVLPTEASLPLAVSPVEIRCTIEEVTFRDEESLFTVAKVRDHDGLGAFVAVGELPSCNAGEEYLLEGRWEEHPKYGTQLRFDKATPCLPSTIDGIERYLGSGLVKGIGKRLARKIVRKFGQETFEIIQKEPDKLRRIKGLGEDRIEGLVRLVKEKTAEREIMLFLYSHGVTPAYASRIYKTYGMDSINLIYSNPYRLAEEIFGIGFKLADRLALSLGLRKDSPERIRAAIFYALSEAEDDGHCFLMKHQITSFTSETITVGEAQVEEVLTNICEKGELIRVSVAGFRDDPEPKECFYGPSLWRAERRTARLIDLLLGGGDVEADGNGPGHGMGDVEKEIKKTEAALGISFAPGQIEAIRASLHHKVSIITGGPGTGKTTALRAIISIFEAAGKKVVLCAPTGRAAKRLSEATLRPAKTIHRLLHWTPVARVFEHNEENPLRCDLVIVDEVSMVDIRLMTHLLAAVPCGASVLLVGDADQLPSVGPGNVLRDLIRSGRIKVTSLSEVFRQAASSMIVSNAHMINRGEMPDFKPREGQRQDFFFVEREEPEEIAAVIEEMVVSRIPSRYSINPMTGIQVLAPMHKGPIGVQALCDRLSVRLNASGEQVGVVNSSIRVGDKVMQVRNNYQLEVFNGDIGVVTHSDPVKREIVVDYEGRSVTYPFDATSELTRAFAISIHKSQGSEYEAVVMPVSTSHYIMLQRNLIYTALTRAKKLAVLVGSKKALAIAVRNDKVRERNTLLAEIMSGKVEM